MGQRRAENGANVGEKCGLRQQGRLKGKEVGQGGVWCQSPGGQREEGHYAGGGRSTGLQWKPGGQRKQDKEISRGVKDNSLEDRKKGDSV